MDACTYFIVFAFTLTIKLAAFNCERTFATDLYNSLPKGNILTISPLALEKLLYYAKFGAKSVAYNELSDALHNSPLRSQLTNNDGNDMLSHIGYLNKNMDVTPCMKQHYPLKSLDYDKRSAAKKINAWINYESDTFIDDIVSAKTLGNFTFINIATLLKLNAEWKKPFEVQKRSYNKKEMMLLSDDFLYGNLEDLKAIAVKITFKDSDLSMIILQPYDNNLKRLGESLQDVNLTGISQRLKKKNLNLFIPTINAVQTNISLKDSLSKMGLSTLFKRPDFGKLHVCAEDTRIADIQLRGRIEMDTSGINLLVATGIQWDLYNNYGVDNSEDANNDVDDDTDTNDEEDTDNNDNDGDIDGINSTNDIEEDDSEIQLANRSSKKKETKAVVFDRRFFYAILQKDDTLFIGSKAK